MRLIVDNRNGVHNSDLEVAHVTIEETLVWLERLDGQQHTLIGLERDDGAQLLIGGGSLYLVITLDAAASSLLYQNDFISEDEIVELSAGGQYGEYLKKNCATKQQSEVVVKHFFAGTEDRLSWQ